MREERLEEESGHVLPEIVVGRHGGEWGSVSLWTQIADSNKEGEQAKIIIMAAPIRVDLQVDRQSTDPSKRRQEEPIKS